MSKTTQKGKTVYAGTAIVVDHSYHVFLKSSVWINGHRTNACYQGDQLNLSKNRSLTSLIGLAVGFVCSQWQKSFLGDGEWLDSMDVRIGTRQVKVRLTQRDTNKAGYVVDLAKGELIVQSAGVVTETVLRALNAAEEAWQIWRDETVGAALLLAREPQTDVDAEAEPEPKDAPAPEAVKKPKPQPRNDPFGITVEMVDYLPRSKDGKTAAVQIVGGSRLRVSRVASVAQRLRAVAEAKSRLIEGLPEAQRQEIAADFEECWRKLMEGGAQ